MRQDKGSYWKGVFITFYNMSVHSVHAKRCITTKQLVQDGECSLSYADALDVGRQYFQFKNTAFTGKIRLYNIAAKEEMILCSVPETANGKHVGSGLAFLIRTRERMNFNSCCQKCKEKLKN